MRWFRALFAIRLRSPPSEALRYQIHMPLPSRGVRAVACARSWRPAGVPPVDAATLAVRRAAAASRAPAAEPTLSPSTRPSMPRLARGRWPAPARRPPAQAFFRPGALPAAGSSPQAGRAPGDQRRPGQRHAGPVHEVGVAGGVEDREIGAGAGDEAANVLASQGARPAE